MSEARSSWHFGILAACLALLVAACGVSVSTPGPSSTAGLPSASIATSTPPPGASQIPTGFLPASTRVTAFFYAWYGTPENDGSWRHWNQLKHSPPDDIASSFYPQRGPYSSRDTAVLAAQMADLRAARIEVIAVSWWGQGSWDDQTLPELFAAAQAAGIRIAFHLEPYTGQTAASVAADIRYLLARWGSSPALYRASRQTSGDPSVAARPVFYLFAASRLPSADLKTAIAGLRGTADDAIVMIHSPRAVSATRVGADGVYTYDALASPDTFAPLVAACKAADIICSPSVAPGFDNSHAVATGVQTVDRAAGARYDSMWQAALSSGSEWVSVTSFDEWHEGTQIEPAVDFAAAGRTYEGYQGAFGATGAGAPRAYLDRTAYWVARLG
jgi:glycoprotein endo-alpha-1,2-mannosidase